MRFLSACVLSVALLVPGSAAAHSRLVEGTIILPAAKAPPALQPVDLAARCAWLTAGSSSQGLLGWVVELTDDEPGHSFSLFGPLDPDVTFYADLGTCDTGEDPDPIRTFSGPTWEADTIPAGARYAVLTVAASSAGVRFAFGIY